MCPSVGAMLLRVATSAYKYLTNTLQISSLQIRICKKVYNIRKVFVKICKDICTGVALLQMCLQICLQMLTFTKAIVTNAFVKIIVLTNTLQIWFTNGLTNMLTSAYEYSGKCYKCICSNNSCYKYVTNTCYKWAYKYAYKCLQVNR
jgi:hypothetical protein